MDAGWTSRLVGRLVAPDPGWSVAADVVVACSGVQGANRRALQEAMTSRAGVLRSAEGLRAGPARLIELSDIPAAEVDQDAWEATNLPTIATLLAGAALRRDETRGSHWRDDFPVRDDEHQSGHHDWWVADGQPQAAFRHASPTDLVVDEVPA